jgi:hypothetical protein
MMLAIAAHSSAAGELFRDPTRPYTARQAAAATQPVFKVNAIIVSAERRIAILNGKRVAVGDTVNGATVKSIGKAELILDVDGLEMKLGLNSGPQQQ